VNCLLSEAEEPIRQTLERLAESPRALRCYVIIESTVTKRFVQFCTPPPPSKFVGGPQLVGSGPLIFDGGGDGKPGGYEPVRAFCDAVKGARWAVDNLGSFLPMEAELRIIEESTRMERPS